MKKKLFGLLFSVLGFTSLLFAQDYSVNMIGPFGGLNNSDNSVIIPANMAQSLLNVDISPGGLSVIKREGYGQAFALPITTSAVHGAYHFYEPGGEDVALFFNDVNMSASISGGDDSILMSTCTYGAVYYCVDSQGYAYCANDNNDAIIKTDGTNFSLLVTPATGTTLAVMPTRLAMAGFSEYPNRIDISESADFTDWTPGGECTDPINFTIVAPGTKITHITYAFDKLIWFKEESFGYIIEGQCISDWEAGTISSNVGTSDNASVYVNGILYFRSQDGHYYFFDGSNFGRLSNDIEETVELSQPLRQSHYTQTDQSDWGDGTYDGNTLYVDTQTSAGSLVGTFPDYFSYFNDGSNGTKRTWTDFSVGSGADGEVSVSNGLLKFSMAGGLLEETFVRTVDPINDIRQGTTIHVKVNEFESTSAYTNRFMVFLSSTPTTSSLPENFDKYFAFIFVSTISTEFFLLQSANDVDGNINVAWYNPVSFPVNLDIYFSTSVMQLTMNSVSTRCATSWDGTETYVYLGVMKGSVGAGTFEIDNFTIVPQTFTYLSPVYNTSGMSSWGNFEASKLETGGSQTFYARASTGSFSVQSSTPSWTEVTPGAKITASTGTYIQIKDLFNYTDSDLGQLALYNFTVNWFEGTTSEVYGIYFDNSIWWTVASGVGATANNQVQKYDLTNNAWTLYDVPINGMLVRNNDLYFGSVSSGYIYKFGGVDDDNGTAIEAYWKSKDFTMGSPFLDKEVDKLSIAAASLGGSALDVTYTFNGSSSTTYSIDLYEPGETFVKNNRNLPVGGVGSVFNVKFGNDAVDSPFEIFAIQYGVKPKPWKPTD